MLCLIKEECIGLSADKITLELIMDCKHGNILMKSGENRITFELKYLCAF